MNLGFTIAIIIGLLVLIPVATAIYGGFILGFAGLPGALVSEIVASKSLKQRIPITGLLVSLFCQAFASLTWIVFVIASSNSITLEMTWSVAVLIWTLSFFVAIGPAWKATRRAVKISNENPEVERINVVFSQKPKVSEVAQAEETEGELKRPKFTVGSITPIYGAILTLPISVTGFFVYALFPDLIDYGWGWVPHF